MAKKHCIVIHAKPQKTQSQFSLCALASLRDDFLIFFLILISSYFLYAQNNFKGDFVKALSSNDFAKIEQIITDNAKHLSESDKRLMYAFTLDYSNKTSALAILELLQNNEIYPSLFDLFNAINRNHSDEVIHFILDKKIIPNGEILLFAAEKNRFNLVNQFAEMGADVNYQYPEGSAYASGATALLHAINKGDFDAVKFLVEHGADVNLADKKGYTPASLSKELELTEIYDYLIAHGAEAVEPPQTAKEETSVNAKNDSAAEKSEQGIASFIDGKQITLQGGTYRLAGGTAEIILPRNSTMGAFTYTRNGIPMMGACRIEKNNLIIMIEGKNHTYTIDSEISFSGYGERWIRNNSL